MGKTLSTILLIALLSMSGCGGDSSSGGATSGSTTDDAASQTPIRYEEELTVEPSGLSGSEPKPVILEAHQPDRIVTKDLLDGVGKVSVTGEQVTVQYVGYDYETGKKFASSWEKGRPVTFTLGAGEVIPAWEEALNGIEVGDRRVVVVPPGPAKGKYPPNIPKGKTVAFILETLPRSAAARAETVSGRKPGEARATSEMSAKEIAKLVGDKTEPKVDFPIGSPPKQLVVKDLEVGTGREARPGDELIVHYVGVNYATHWTFRSSWEENEPVAFTLGAHEVIDSWEKVIKGWEEGLKGMKVGGRRELITPPRYAYGPEGAGKVAPDATLVFVIDLLKVK